MSYTLGTAAKATGRDRATISRAIRKGRVSATKNAHGEWQIDPAELHRVYPPLQADNSARDSASATARNSELYTDNKVLEARLEGALQRIAALEADKAFLQTELTRATALLADQRERRAPAQRSWWRIWR